MFKKVLETKIEKKTKFTVTLVCDTCGSNFSRIANKSRMVALMNNDHHFCNHACYGISRKRGGHSYKKSQDTCEEKYGYSHHMKSLDFKKKFDDLIEEKYGVRNVAKAEQVRKKLSEINSRPELIEEKRKRWEGDLNPAKQEEVKEKIVLGLRSWCRRTYGVDNPSQVREFYERSRQTCKERFGDIHPIRVLENKRRETCLKKYGSTNPLNSSYVMDKIMLKKWNMTWDEKKETLSEYEKYSREVWKVTISQPLEYIENYDLRGKDYHLDHKFSIAEGFRQGISSKIIGNIVNLEILPSRENILKSDSCSIDKQTLLLEYHKRNQHEEDG